MPQPVRKRYVPRKARDREPEAASAPAKLVLMGESESPQFKHIAVADLLEPDIAARSTMNPHALCELKESIEQVGIIEPLVVSPEDGKYRVRAGHRRLIAARELGLVEVPCVIRRDSDISHRAITAHENAVREDLNPAEEARYFKELLELDCGGDCIVLAQLLRRPQRYVEDRLMLLAGDALVFEAMAAGLIGPGVAQELNKVLDPSRRAMYLDAAAKGGATIAMVRNWRVQGNLQDAMLAGATSAQVEWTAPRASAPEPMRCTLCGGSEDAYEMMIMYVHRGCARYVERTRLAAAAEPASVPNPELPPSESSS